MWSKKQQKKLIREFGKKKDLYKFLELLSLVHEEVSDDFRQKKTLNVREDVEFIKELMKIIKPKVNRMKSMNIIPSHLSFDANIYYSLEGLFLGLSEYLNSRPKEDTIKSTTEGDIKKLIGESYKNLLKFKREKDLELCKEQFSKAAALLLSGVPVNEYFGSQIPYKSDNRILLWTESIMQIIDHSKDYPITAPSNFQETINLIWKNLKNYEIDESLLSSPNVKKNSKKTNILLKNFIREFLKNETEIDKTLRILRPMYAEYINRLIKPKIKKATAVSAAKELVGNSEVVDCEILNIDSDVINKMIDDYNKRYSKNVDLFQEDYITVWKITLKKKKMLSKKSVVVFVDSIKGDIVGSYM